MCFDYVSLDNVLVSSLLHSNKVVMAALYIFYTEGKESKIALVYLQRL